MRTRKVITAKTDRDQLKDRNEATAFPQTGVCNDHSYGARMITGGCWDAIGDLEAASSNYG